MVSNAAESTFLSYFLNKPKVKSLGIKPAVRISLFFVLCLMDRLYLRKYKAFCQQLKLMSMQDFADI